MAVHTQPPLVGPARRRGLREILRLAPLAESPHTALVITRRGALVGVVPAGDRRTLSDYIDLPCEIREVDMRERPLVIARQCESAEQGFSFDVTLQIAYQVARPAHVALAHADVLSELEEAIHQRARAVAATLGVEQASALKAYLVEALVTGNELPQRFEELGLALRRVDVAVELGDPERTRAEAVRDQTRDRPLLARFRVETRDSDATFDTQVGGFYRLSSRDAEVAYSSAEETIYDIVARALSRVGVQYGPEQYRDAARAMTDHLWTDGVLKAELAAGGVELLRPAVHIYPDRALLDQLGRPLMLEDGRRRDPRIRRLSVSPRLALAAPREPAETEPPLPFAEMPPAEPEVSYVAEAEVVEDAPPPAPAAGDDWLSEWQALSASAIEESSYSVADAEPDDHALVQPGAVEEPSRVADAELVEAELADEVLAPASSAAETEHGLVATAPVEDEALPASPFGATNAEEAGWTLIDDALPAAEPELGMPEAPPAPASFQPELRMPEAAAATESAEPAPGTIQADEPPVDVEILERMLVLLQSSGPALYKLATLELVETPSALPGVLREHTADAALLEAAHEPSVQQGLVALITGGGQLKELRDLRAPVASRTLPAADEGAPDWLQLRAAAHVLESFAAEGESTDTTARQGNAV